MIYLDTAALVKLLRREPESDALADWLDTQADTLLVASVLVEMELPRALRRVEPDLIAGVPGLLERIARYEIDDLVRVTAATYTDPQLRSLDAIHLATAHAVFGPRLTAFVTYDQRLLTSAAALGLPVHCPTPSD
ncbi:type II toxin-antitoxin system VapC family toxin [Pseudonocardia sp. H11422]|uniref:type II toxin-antitoxin system VapC family toxin n=1 Tax=Pseudonocardia sp. H11422 TaxID=2835866 RepID=UPI001BDC34B7|nr:type II toxin-antitoxin system VapC family toxin [Pseudonocardia sp. H11422]